VIIIRIRTAQGLSVLVAFAREQIGATVMRHSKYVLFQLAEVAVPRQLFARILGRIARLGPACASG
jgi:hypothetical protein